MKERISSLSFSAAAVLATSAASMAHAQCDPIDFEDFSLGEVLTEIAPGVHVDAVPDTCGGSVDVIVVQPPGGASSGLQAMSPEAGCPSFSPEMLAVYFDEVQFDVSFTVGTTIGTTVHVRAWSQLFGGVLRYSDSFATTTTANGFVHVDVPDGFHRIEIEADSDDFEHVDDLAYGADTTPPTAEITSPTFLQCYCGDDMISVVGAACDDDGTYAFDMLEYRPVNAPASDPWTFIGSYTSPLCGEGPLYTVDASGLPSGALYLRLTVQNTCGLIESAITVVRIDRSPPGVAYDATLAGADVCGEVDICGSISDSCGVAWTVEAQPVDGGPSILIADEAGGRCGLITRWDTADVASGEYVITITAEDTCGYVTIDDFVVNVTEECGSGPDIDGDGIVGIGDLLLLLAAWGT